MTHARSRNRIDDFISRPRRSIWILALPMMAAFSTHSLYMVFDMVFIGRLGAAAMAAAQFVGALFFGVIALNIGFTTGVTAVIARAVGQRDRRLAERTAANAMGIGLLFGVLISGTGFLLGPTIVPLLGAKGETTVLALQYFEVLCIGMLFMFLSGAIRAVLNGEGDAKTPMTIAVAGTLINLVFDPIFMFVFEFGIRGAAMATVLSQLFTISAYCYVAFVKKRSYIPFSWSLDSLRPRGRLISPIFRIGFPAALGHLTMSLGAILYNRIIAEFGQASVAGYGAGSKVDMIVALPIIALASAVMSVVGMFAGAKRFDLVRKVIGYAFRTSVSITLLFSIAAFFASSYIIRIFTDDPDALQVGHVYLQYMVFAYPLMAVGVTAGRILQGLGLGFPPFIITFMRVLLIGVPLSYVGVHYFHAPIDVIWMTMIGGSLIANILAVYWIRHYGWTVPAAANENAPSVVLSTTKTGPPLDTLPPP